MYYIDITAEDLHKLKDGLEIMGKLYRSSGNDIPSLYLYGLTSDPGILDAAKEAIAAYADIDEEETTEDDIELAEVCCEIGLSEDVLYYLLGSGVKMGRGDEFTYMGKQGEGIREVGWQWTKRQPSATVASFTKMALAADSGWSDKFMQQYGNKIPMQVKVQRTTPATGVAPTQTAPAAAPAGQPKQTSVPGAKTLHNLMENFLGE